MESIDNSTRNAEESTVLSRSEHDTLTSNQCGRPCNTSGAVLQSHHHAITLSSLSAIAPHKRKINDLSDLTVDKLRLHSLELHGRNDEKLKLSQDFQSLVQDSSSIQRCLFLISGESGTGKTRLAETLREPVSRRNGLFVKGKFDLVQRNQPYSGISSAFAEICDAIRLLKRQEPVRAKAICDEIEESLGKELYLLNQTIPLLSEIVSVPDQGASSHELSRKSPAAASISTYTAKNQFNFAFIRLFRVFAKNFFPFIFVLDDLQWADVSSFDLLEALMTDHQLQKFMLIAIYRSSEVDETHIFHRYLQELATKSIVKEFTMTQLQIHDLDLMAVNSMILDILGCDDPSQTIGLAEVCFKKTHGNPFYLIHYLSMLYKNQLLKYNFGTLSWNWNNEEIELSTPVSNNVVHLLKNRMVELPDHLLDILKIAACLGSTFERQLLQLVWSKFFNVSDDDPPLVGNFVACIEELVDVQQLFVMMSDTPPRIAWVHDKIHEAAIALVPRPTRQAHCARVGTILASELEEQERDAAIFVIVDLMNGSTGTWINDDRDHDVNGRLELARLNLQASQKAVRLSSFESAAKYAGQGISLLPPKAWEEEYELCLMLHCIGAKSEGFVGNRVMMDRYCQAVLSQVQRPIEDKFDVYHTLIDNLTNQGKTIEAAMLLLDILGRFKCRFPKNPFLIGLGIIRNIMLIRVTMKSRNISKLVSLNDTTRVHLMEFLGRLSTCFYLMNDDRLPLIVFRSLNWTMKYGKSDYSAPVFAATAIFLTGGLNDIHGGVRYAQHALALLDMSPSHTSAARTMFCVYSYVFPWSQQLRLTLNPLLQTYDIGLRTGDAESAIWAIGNWLVIKFMIGCALESLDADLKLYLKQMKDIKRDPATKITKTLHQAVLNLMGENGLDDPTQLIGTSLSEAEFRMSSDEAYWRAGVWFYRGALYTYFGQHIKHAESLIEVGHRYYAKAHIACLNNMMDAFLKGVSCYAAARQTGQRKYVRLAKICRSKIKKWLAKGNPNVNHYDLFLDAEDLALKGKKGPTIMKYEAVILYAARSGYQQDAALANERLGEFYLSVMKDRDEGAYRLREAEKYWRSWGALGKVEHLKQMYPDVFREE